MNLFDILFMQKTGKIKPDADLFDIMFAKVTGVVERLVTIIGNPLLFTAKKAQTAKSTKVTLEPIQAGSGDPSPTNVRPISGRSSVEIKGCGKNQHNGEVYIVNKYIGSSGNLVTSNNYNVYKLNGVSAGEYTLSVYDNTEELLNIVLCAQGFDNNNNQTFLNYTTHPSSKSRESITFTVPSGTSYVLYCFRITDYDIQVETGSSATTYEPYTESNDVTITLGETVYGGTLDVETGVLTVDKGMKTINEVIANRTTSYAHPVFYGQLSDMNVSSSSYRLISDTFRYIGSYGSANAFANAAADNRLGRSSTSNRQVYIRCDDYTTVTELKQEYGDVMIVYDLATPITIQLTPEQIQILKGQNNIWIEDVGASIELTYKA